MDYASCQQTYEQPT